MSAYEYEATFTEQKNGDVEWRLTVHRDDDFVMAGPYGMAENQEQAEEQAHAAIQEEEEKRAREEAAYTLTGDDLEARYGKKPTEKGVVGPAEVKA